MKRIEYIDGQMIGECMFINEVEKRGQFRMGLFKCLKCDDKRLFVGRINRVKDGDLISCGCMRGKTHGLKYHPLYVTWSGAKSRCYNKNHPRYKDYGGRGIKMYNLWVNDFKAFYDYAITLDGYDEKLLGKNNGYSIDRYPNNNGNYEPGNLRFTNDIGQSRNRRKQISNTSGYRGVSFSCDKYFTTIGVNGEKVYLGAYKTVNEAVTARNNYIIENNLTDYKIQNVQSTIMLHDVR